MNLWNKIRGSKDPGTQKQVAVERLEEQRRTSHQNVDDLFDRSIAGLFQSTGHDYWAKSLAQHVDEDDDSFTLRLDVPGFDPKDLSVSVAFDRVVVEGERSESQGKPGEKEWSRSSGSLYLDIPLRCEVTQDGATAGVKHGVLTVHLPKAEEAKALIRRIPISS